MSVIDIIAGSGASAVVREKTQCGITTQVVRKDGQYKLYRFIHFAGRNISLGSPLDMFQREAATRDVTPTESIVANERIEASRTPLQELGNQ